MTNNFFVSVQFVLDEDDTREERNHDVDYINILKYLLTNLHKSFMYIHLSHSFT